MSNCPPITLPGITPDKFQSLLAHAQSQGLNLTGDNGSTSYQGMDFTWVYDPAEQTLILTCTSKPIFIPCSLIESRIRSMVN